LNNSKFGDYVDRIDHIELKIWDTLDKERSASYLDIHTEEDRLTTKLYHKKKRVEFKFLLRILCLFVWAFPTSPVYGRYISHLIPYSRACGSGYP